MFEYPEVAVQRHDNTIFSSANRRYLFVWMTV